MAESIVSTPVENVEHLQETPPPPPFPAFQLFINLLIQAAEPITATVIFPFIARLVASTGVTGGNEKAIGYYAGFIESTFFFAEAASVYHWARASDYYGRRPILLLGPVGLGFSMLGFGLSRNYWILILFRALQGNFNGLIGVSKTVMAEMVGHDQTQLARALSGMPLMWSSGLMFGPIIGGTLSEPASKWAVFDRPFFRHHPYFLPCAVAGALAWFTAFVGALFLKETSPRLIQKQNHKKAAPSSETALIQDSSPSYGSTQTSSGSHASEHPPTIRQLLTPEFVLVLTSYGSLAFFDMGYNALIPLVWSSSHAVGGLGLSPSIIGGLMASMAIGGAILQMLIMPAMLRRWDKRQIFRFSLLGIGAATACLGAASFLVRRAGRVDATVWTLLVGQILLSLVNYPAYTTIMLIIVQTSTKESLASVNSIAQMVAVFVRGCSPSISSSLYALSLEKDILGGYLIYLLINLGVLSAFIIARNLPQTR